MPSPTRNEQGMTIVEMLVAIGIISVGLVALSSAIPLAAYGIREGSQLSTATFLANQRLEQVRNAMWLDPATGDDCLGVSPSSTAAPVGTGPNCAGVRFPDENPMTAPYAGYTRTVRITSCVAGCAGIVDAGLRQVTVTARYRPMTGVGVAPAGTTKSAVITMYITQR